MCLYCEEKQVEPEWTILRQGETANKEFELAKQYQKCLHPDYVTWLGRDFAVGLYRKGLLTLKEVHQIVP
jgi:hypothetical protein